MSTDRPMNSETIEQTKQQIRGLVSEIAQLSKSDLNADEYYAALMQRIVSALAAVGGAVWLLNDSRRTELRYQINLSETLLDSASEDADLHRRLLDRVMKTGEPQLIPPSSGASDEAGGGNPTRYLLVLAPLVADGKVEGVIEVFQRPDSQPATQRGYLRFLVQMCELAGEWLKPQKLKVFSDRHSLWANADHFARLVHESLDTRETCYTIVNEGRRLIGCDRVSVAIMRGNRCKVEAISGQDSIEHRSNIVTTMNKLATRVTAMGEPLWFDGSAEDLPPQISEALDAYIDESYAKTLTIIPIRRPKTAEERTNERGGDQTHETNEANEIIGALIVEQLETDVPSEVLTPRIDLVFEHAARSLANSLDHNGIILMPLLKAISSLSFVVKAHNLPKTLSITAAVIVVLLCLFLVPADFDLKAKGTLQPTVRRDVFASMSGRVEEVFVEDKAMVKGPQYGPDGELIEPGAALIRLENEDLEIELKDVSGRLESTIEQLSSAQKSQLSDRGLNRFEKTQLAGQIRELKVTRDSLHEQLDLVLKKRENLIIRAPISGQAIINWDVEKSLKSRSIDRGQVLMTIADLSSEWELELYMKEGRMSHISDAQAVIKEDLNVRYILATNPGIELEGTVKSVHGATQMHEQEGSSVRIAVQIDKADIHELRPGATVTGGVQCGRAPLGYTWFHEVFEWVQTNLLF